MRERSGMIVDDHTLVHGWPEHYESSQDPAIELRMEVIYEGSSQGLFAELL